MPSLNVSLEPGKTVHVKLVKGGYITQTFSYTVPTTPTTVTKTMVIKTGTLSLTTSPTGATVDIYEVGPHPEGPSDTNKGAHIGIHTTPFTVDLEPRDYVYKVTKIGYAFIWVQVSVTAGLTTTKSHTLIPLAGTLSVATTPTGATVKVGTETKTSPCNFTLAPGTHTVTVSKPGYNTKTDMVAITSGATTTKSYTLVLSEVTITFDTKKEDGSTLTGVDVFVDGARRGTT